MDPIESLIFDFDGVVVDSEPLYEKAELELFASYGVHVNLEDIKDTKGLPEKVYLQIIKDRYQIEAPIEEMSRCGQSILKRYFAEELDYVPGFTDFYSKIEQRLPVALATSSSRELLDWIFENTKIHNHFPYCITANDVTHSKPNPEPYLKACQKLGVKPENTIVVEDSLNGIKSARAASTVTIALLHSNEPSMLPGATYYVYDYEHLAEVTNTIIEARKAK